MRVAINAMSVRANYGGIGIYTKNLIEALAHIDKKNHYLLLLNVENYHDFRIPRENFENLIVWAPFRKYYIWEQFCLPFILKKRKIDLIHGPRAVLPLLCRIKSVVTIHDLAFLFRPDFMPFNPIRYWDIFVKRSVLKADHVIAVSENTKRDLVRSLSVPASKITVTYEGCNGNFKLISESRTLARISQKYGLPRRFILYVGTIEPRKNLNVLLFALEMLKRKHGISAKLVMVGKKGWFYSDFFNTIYKLKLQDDITLLGYVQAEDLPYIYNLADVFVYPSKYEGFGLPLLEAMACGVPVISSNTSSIPEILGDAGSLFSPDDPGQLSESILEILGNEALRAKMVLGGFRRAQLFSWQETAQRTLNIYESICNRTPRL